MKTDRSTTAQKPPLELRHAGLYALGRRIRASVHTGKAATVDLPDDLRLLHDLPWDELQSFAKNFRLNVGSRMRGRIYEFTPDTELS